MSKSASLRVREVRALIRLAGDCRDLGDDHIAWRWHFLEHLSGMVGADAGLNGELAGCRALKNIDLGVLFWWPSGFSPPPFWDAHLERFRDDGGYSPVMSEYHRFNRDDPGHVRSRKEFVDDRDWYKSYDYLKVHEPLGFDNTLWCFRALPGTRADENSGIILVRAIGRRDFSGRDRLIVREAHAAISPLIGGPLARFADPSPRALTPRVRRILSCLLEGDSDKQVASRLGLSPYTVNQHTKTIYRHFGVQSRAELLSRWVRRGWSGRFPWADDNTDEPEGDDAA